MATNNTTSDPITDINDDRLDPFRPDESIVDSYVSRTLPGGLKDTTVLMSYFVRRQNIMLAGDTQSGKTLLVQVMAVLGARKIGLPKPLPVFLLSGSSGITDFDLFGQNTVWTDPETGEEKLVWLPGVVDTAARVGGILYCDEVTHMEDRVISSLHPLTDFRRTFVNRAKAVQVEGGGFLPETVSVHPDLWIVGTYNVGYRGTASLPEAFANRFQHLRWDYDEDVEKQLIRDDSIRTLASAVRSARERGQISTPCGVSALQKLQDDSERFGAEFAVWAFIGMFPPREREKIEHLFDSMSIASLLNDEVTTTKQYDEEAS